MMNVIQVCGVALLMLASLYIPAEQLPEAQYKEFIDEFGRE